MSSKADVAIIGGTGLYSVEGLQTVDTILPETPWGLPSDEIHIAEYEESGKKLRIAFLPRHGKGHFISPTMIPQKANMAALKMLGVSEIIAFSAVGSLKEEIAPTHFIVPDQVIDRTRHRDDTYYNEGVVVHVMFGDPFCHELKKICVEGIKRAQIDLHTDETLICMEGPAFSTRAESKLYKSWGAGIINMSVLPEAKLARELEMAYQMICMSTDYDSWREDSEAVNAVDIMAVVKKNSEQAAKTVKEILPLWLARHPVESSAKSAVKFGIITAKEKRPESALKKLHKVLPEYF